MSVHKVSINWFKNNEHRLTICEVSENLKSKIVNHYSIFKLFKIFGHYILTLSSIVPDKNVKCFKIYLRKKNFSTKLCIFTLIILKNNFSSMNTTAKIILFPQKTKKGFPLKIRLIQNRKSIYIGLKHI